jgi:hypothetical protein
MSEPLKDFGRLAICQRDHRVLSRIARARDITMQELAREVFGAYVQRVIHDAKVVLGQDDDNDSVTEASGAATESHGSSRSGRR